MIILKLETVKSPIGDVTIVHEDGAVVLVDFKDNEVRINSILNKNYGAEINKIQWMNSPSVVALAVEEYFKGVRETFVDIKDHLKLIGTDFQNSVWAALLSIPYGETKTYKDIAIEIGRPKAMRAVGAANGKNPISILLPCHRVIGADGTLTGYAGGLVRKEWLLSFESK